MLVVWALTIVTQVQLHIAKQLTKSRIYLMLLLAAVPAVTRRVLS
jgi:hypothetical protein